MNKHQSSIEALSWKEIRDDVIKIKPAFAKIIDKLSPNEKFIIYKAKYPFGTKIAHEGCFYLPTKNGLIERISSPNVDNQIKSNLQRRDLPAILMLNNSAEMFYEMPDRIISGFLMRPGSFMGLWEQFDPPNNDYVKWSWSLVSGARTLYMLPRITNVSGHKELRKKYGVHSHVPKTYSEHWKIFSEIVNSQAFEEEWYSEMIFFSDIWFDHSSKDPVWQEFYKYLFEEAWHDSMYWRQKNAFELIWENFIYEVMDSNIKPNLYLAYIVKQLILTGSGVLPGLTVADDDSVGPIKTLQQVYTEDYKLKNYIPLFMCPHNFSLDDSFPTYYSLQYPNLLETIPVSQNLPSVLGAIPEIRSLIEAFHEKTVRNYVTRNTPIDNFCKNVSLDYFHYHEEKWNDIKSTSDLPLEDRRLIKDFVNSKNNVFPNTSNLISGCVRFKNIKTKLI